MKGRRQAKKKMTTVPSIRTICLLIIIVRLVSNQDHGWSVTSVNKGMKATVMMLVLKMIVKMVVMVMMITMLMIMVITKMVMVMLVITCPW